jgi:hypothetical protein
MKIGSMIGHTELLAQGELAIAKPASPRASARSAFRSALDVSIDTVVVLWLLCAAILAFSGNGPALLARCLDASAAFVKPLAIFWPVLVLPALGVASSMVASREPGRLERLMQALLITVLFFLISANL